MALCEHKGTSPEFESWVGMRAETFDLLTDIFVKAGHADANLWDALFGIECPFSLPDSFDGPTIGFVPHSELKRRLEPFTAVPHDLPELDYCSQIATSTRAPVVSDS